MALDAVTEERLSTCTLIRPVIVKLFEENIDISKYGQLTDKMFLIQGILQNELYEKYVQF